jgi:hypothetical protein
MPFIKKQDKTPTVELKTRVREDNKTLVEAYAAYLESDLNYVVEQLLVTAIGADKDFRKSRAGAAVDRPKVAKKPRAKKAAAPAVAEAAA